VNVGVTIGFTVTVIVVVFAHSPAAGVNGISSRCCMSFAGDHVPAIPLLELSGNVKLSPSQIGATWVKVGVTARIHSHSHRCGVGTLTGSRRNV
jgi:hypothetical protein